MTTPAPNLSATDSAASLQHDKAKKLSWRVHPASEFAGHKAEWDRLNARFGSSPLLDSLFVGPMLAAFGDGGEKLAIAESRGVIAAMALFQRRGRASWQTFQPANAPLGPMIIDPSVVRSTSDLGHRNLALQLSGPALLIGWSQVEPDFLPRPPAGGPILALDYIDTARVTLSGNYESYWAARGKNLRHNMNRQRNRLERDGIEMRLEILTRTEDMARAVDDYADMESAGWKQAAASAVQREDSQGRFYKEMLSAFAERGEACVLRLFYDDKLVATDLCLLRDRCLIILKTTHDETCKGTSPAHLMRHETIKVAFQNRMIESVEFYGPVKDWHLKWTDDVRTLYHLNFYRWPGLRTLHQRQLTPA